MKKLLALLIAGIFMTSLLASCTKKHVHTAVGGWESDPREHWHVCEDGEKMDVGAHTLDDSDTCTVCRTEIIDLGDGSYDLYVKDEHDEMIRTASYDSEGKLTTETRNQITYDANGNKTLSKSYIDGVFTDETHYAMGANGIYEAKYIHYHEDGSYFTNEYNEDTDLILARTYDENGVETHRDVFEYAVGEDGERYEKLNTSYDYVEKKIFIMEFNELGDQIGRKVCELDGTVIEEGRYEITYNEDGEKETVKEYENGRLVFEILSYAVYEDEDYSIRYPKTTVDYNEDGSKIVTEYAADDSKIEYEYDANGNLVKTTSYDADGNEIS